MGMHFGILVAQSPWANLFTSLQKQVPGLVDKGPLPSLGEFSTEPTDDGFALAGGEYNARSYLIDGSMSVSDQADLIADVARALNCLVVGCGAETVSGSFWLTIAQGAKLRRLYWQCYMELSRPLSLGEPLACESQVTLDGIDGQGLFAVLKSLGFDFESWEATTQNRSLAYPLDVSLSEDGPLMSKVNQHRAAFKLSPQEVPPIQVVGRIQRTQRPGILSRVFGLLGWR
jgi:hypothetical protein